MIKNSKDFDLEEIEIPKLTKNKRVYFNFKLIVDCVLTVVFAIPIFIIVFLFGILVILDSEGPMFYSQERVGIDGKVFKIYKLRSMVVHFEPKGKSTWTEANDPRITRIGKFIRKLRIDELPQFLNILKGDMSLIGPRPERPDLTMDFINEIPGFEKRLAVRPGITGLAQVNGGYDHTPSEKLQYDLEYIENYGLVQDVKVFAKTIAVVLTGDGAR